MSSARTAATMFPTVPSSLRAGRHTDTVVDPLASTRSAASKSAAEKERRPPTITLGP